VWPFEIANAIFVSFNKRKRINENQIQEYLARLKALPIRLESRDLWANVDLESQARNLNLAAYDIAYLELAKRKSLPLATADDDLEKAALVAGIDVVK